MSLSKIIRSSDNFECHSVAMSNLDEIIQSKAASFVVLDSSVISAHSEVESPSALPDKINGPDLEEQEKIAAQELEKTKKKAYAEGKQNGLAESEKRLGQATKALAAACSEISSLKEKMLQRSSDDMLRLVLAIAQRVVQAELSLGNDVIGRTVQQAIQMAVSAEEFHIMVNPDDIQAVQEHKPLFIASLSGLSNIEFVPDPAVTRGGCVLESPLGRVDATIEAQMEAINSCLQEAIREG